MSAEVLSLLPGVLIGLALGAGWRWAGERREGRSREAERLLRRHVGVCLDACHASVEYERPVMALQKLRSAGIAVPKIQLSAGLRLGRATPEALAELRAFDDGIYFHQTVVAESDGDGGAPRRLQRFVDLTSHGPARLFGIVGKGRIAVGYDADLTVVDLKRTMTITNDWIKSRAGWTPYDGGSVRGWPVGTFVRGNAVMWDGEILTPAIGEPVRFYEAS